MNVSRSGPQNRVIFTVTRQSERWGVERDGDFVLAGSKEEARPRRTSRPARQDFGKPLRGEGHRRSEFLHGLMFSR